jgi:hypothetical protein
MSGLRFSLLVTQKSSIPERYKHIKALKQFYFLFVLKNKMLIIKDNLLIN